jgi:hypothetical protein
MVSVFVVVFDASYVFVGVTSDAIFARGADLIVPLIVTVPNEYDAGKIVDG